MTDIVDLDALLKADIAKAIKDTKYIKVKAFGEEWRLTTSPNVFTSLGAAEGNVEDIKAMFSNMIHPDDREAFTKALRTNEGISADVLMKLLSGMLEAVADRPTKSPSDKSRSSRATSAGTRKSAAS